MRAQQGPPKPCNQPHVKFARQSMDGKHDVQLLQQKHDVQQGQYLKDPIQSPPCAEPDHGRAKPKHDVDDSSGHETTSQHDSW